MEQRSSTVATRQRTTGLAPLGRSNTEVHAAGGIGGGGAGPSLGVVPGRRLGRQATLAKGLRLLQPPAALPLFDMSVAVIDSLNLMRASMEEEVVLQSTLAVPAHQALACRIEAYGSPFGAPGLQAAVAGEMTEDDKTFAACLAAPPDFDAAATLGPAASLQRMASLGVLGRQQVQQQQQQHAQQDAPGLNGGAAKDAASGRAPQLLRLPSVQDPKKDKKAEGWRARLDPDPQQGRDPAAAAAAGPQQPSVSTAEGRAAIAALAREAQRGSRWQRRLFEGCRDPVAALVGTGYLLLRAAGFDARTPAAVGGLAGGLRRLSSLPPAARADAALSWGLSVAPPVPPPSAAAPAPAGASW